MPYITWVIGCLLIFTSVDVHGMQRIGTFDNPKPISSVLRDENKDGNPDLLGSSITTSGRATVGSFVFHQAHFISYMQDAGAGIMLYSENLDKKINVGDSLVVSGKLKLYYGKPEIVIDSLKRIPAKPRVFPPLELIKTFEDPERYLSQLVEGEAIVTGLDLNKGATNITISPMDTARLSMWVYISNNHIHKKDFKLSRLSLGDRIIIKGILDKYLINGDVIYEIMPRSPDDITYARLPQKFLSAILWGSGIFIFMGFAWVFMLRKQVEARTNELSKALEDNNVLMQEFHHRVKNNLSIIVGLIELKIMAAHDRELKDSLEDTKSRINSLTLIHDKLYQKQLYTEVRLDGYLKELVEAIHSTFSDRSKSVNKKFKLEPVKIPVNKAVNCGLLVNEVVVNAFKHAFCEDLEGELEVVLKKIKDEETILLSIKDNGPGFEGNFTNKNNDGIGTMLIESIADQLKADIHIDGCNGNGTCVSLSIPLTS